MSLRCMVHFGHTMFIRGFVGRFASPVRDLAALGGLALLYALPILLRPGDTLPLGGDLDSVVAPYAFVRESILALRFPTWNPYYTTGQPYLGDPLSSYLSPIILLPVIAFGVAAGVKVAVVLSLFLAGAGQWALARVVGLPRMLGLWSAALFMLSGNLAAKFSSGQLEKILSYPWIPFSVALVLLALRRPRPHWIVLAALSTVMPILSGDYYAFLYTVIAGVVVVIVHAVLKASKDGSVRPLLTSAGLYGGILCLAVGLAAVRLLPSLELLPRMFRVVDPYVGSQHLHGVLADFLLFPRRLYAEPFVANLFGYGGGELWWEWYAFLGPLPFVGLFFLHRAWRQPDVRQQVIVLAALGGVSLLVIANGYAYSPFHWLWQALPALGGFRFPVRALVLTTSALLLLTAIGFAFWRAAGWRRYLKAGVLGLGVATALVVNGYVLYTAEPVPAYGAREAIAWLRQHDAGVFYVQIHERAPGEPRWRTFAQYEFVSAHVKMLDSYHGWFLKDTPALWNVAPQGTLEPPGAPGTVRIRARYLFTPEGQGQALARNGYGVIATVGGFDILKTDAALPYAFVLPQGADARPDSAREVSGAELSPGRVVLTASAQAGDRIVALETFYPGWSVRVDDGAAAPPADAYMGVLSTTATPGAHRYVFEYRPVSFAWGLVLSGGAAALLLVLLVAGKRLTGIFR